MEINLSQKSLKEAQRQLEKFREEYSKGVKNAVKRATEVMYNKVIDYCKANGIHNHTSEIYWEYDESSNTGRVYTNDKVIIFNEMGTGITGKGESHPSPSENFKDWDYDRNDHGEKGWKYPKGDGTFGWTRGLPSRHMFYDAFTDMQKEIGDIVNVEIEKTVGDLYKGR